MIEAEGSATEAAPVAESAPVTPAPVAEAKVEAAPAAPATSGAVSTIEVTVPDIGTDDEVDIIDILVAVGDTVSKEDGLITLETDKATMDVPCPEDGVVKEIKVAVGGKVGQGSLVLLLETGAAQAERVQLQVQRLHRLLKLHQQRHQLQ